MSMIRVEKISFSYNGKRVLKEVSFSAEAGQVTGILGPNGSGKSTLLSVITGGLSPNDGRVLLAGQPVSRFGARELARTLSLVPQSSRLEFDFTVQDAVLMGRHPYIGRFAGENATDLDIARDAMEQTGVLHLAERLVTKLSGGEWQRVVIARALAQRTPVILLDEPVSNLDIKYQIEVLDVVRRLAKANGVTVICVLHDLNLAAHYCDRVVLLSEGELIAYGAPDDVLASAVSGVYGVPLIEAKHPVTGELCLFPTYGAQSAVTTA